jgi:hypothetical protein
VASKAYRKLTDRYISAVWDFTEGETKLLWGRQGAGASAQDWEKPGHMDLLSAA